MAQGFLDIGTGIICVDLDESIGWQVSFARSAGRIQIADYVVWLEAVPPGRIGASVGTEQ